jgi:hypothetical protein
VVTNLQFQILYLKESNSDVCLADADVFLDAAILLTGNLENQDSDNWLSTVYLLLLLLLLLLLYFYVKYPNFYFI